jgi:hypothetical protein
MEWRDGGLLTRRSLSSAVVVHGEHYAALATVGSESLEISDTTIERLELEADLVCGNIKSKTLNLCALVGINTFGRESG